MNEKYIYLVSFLAVILMLAIAGCVAPPTENATTPLDQFDPNKPVTTAGQTGSSFVSEVTLSDYGTTATKSSGFTTFASMTQIPADITCRIHGISMFGYNGTAFTFNLKNPPMYINYSVTPKNVTVNKVYTDSFTKKTVTLTYSDYSPSSWFEVIVRDNATKEVILKDGFGENKGYTIYLTRTLKVMKSGDLLVEFRGNDITAAATVWVKPIGNFDDSRLSEFTDCTYWDARRDTVAPGKTATIKDLILTWTPENQVTQ